MASTLIVLSDLCWSSACLPLHHVLTRLATQHPVVFVEAPRRHAGRAFRQMHTPMENVRVARTHTPLFTPGFHDGQFAPLRELMRALKAEHAERVAWVCNPLALPLVQELDPMLVVADCSDSPLVPRRTQRRLQQRERVLLDSADLILTATPVRFRELRARHAHVHSLEPGIDVRHFEAALDRANSHPLHRDIPGPRLGYHGVIDARLDLGLIRDLADAHPVWQIVLAGPVSGLAPATLPRRPNIHYLGAQDYDDLPRLLAGWDVCLLPYARHALVNPATVLPCLAAELPVVATPQKDLIEYCGAVIETAADARDFVAACEQALLARHEDRAPRIARMRQMVAQASWDACAAEVAGLLRVAWQCKQAAMHAPAALTPSGTAGTPLPA